MINEEVRHIIEPELEEGEELLWADRPQYGFRFKEKFFKLWRLAVRLSIYCGIIVSGLMALAGLLSYREVIFIGNRDESIGMMIGGVIMFLLCWPMLFLFTKIGDFALKVTKSVQDEVYGITQKRGLIISPSFKYRTRNITPKEMRKCKVRGKDVGRIKFPIASVNIVEDVKNAFYGHLFNFHNIKNPKDVRDFIRQNFPKGTP